MMIQKAQYELLLRRSESYQIWRELGISGIVVPKLLTCIDGAACLAFSFPVQRKPIGLLSTNR